MSPTTAEHVLDDLGADVDAILDGGSCDVGVESTIVECLDHSVAVLRPGKITTEQIQSVLETLVTPPSGESRAPGMMLSHYSPDAAVYLVDDLDEAQRKQQDLTKSGMSVRMVNYDDASEYARHLYQELREADLAGIDAVVAVLPPPVGIGMAVRDRLSKAAAR